MSGLQVVENRLAIYSAAVHALSEAKAVDEVKDWRDKAEAMRAYAHQAKNRQLEIDAAEIRMRAERRLGELIRGQKETVGLNPGGFAGNRYTGPVDNSRGVITSDTPKTTLTLESIGVSRNLSSHAQKVAAIPEQEFESIVTDWRESLETANERVTTNILKAAEKAHNHRAQGTGENEWYTPDQYIDLARQVMGAIDLDPASSEIANKQVQASKIFTIDDDGLRQDWHGKIWLNPPYSQPHIRMFAEKLAAEVKRGTVSEAIALTHNYTDTAWFHLLAECCSSICFTRGRIGFLSPEGAKASPTQGQAFFYFGANSKRFAERFSSVGFIVEYLGV